MMDLARTWLIGITAAALIAALAESLTPEGTVKKICKLASGLLLMIAILNPLIKLDHSILASAMVEYQIETDEYRVALETENQRLVKTIIEEQAGAYIQDKADELGIACTVEIACQKNGKDVFYPVQAIVYGDLSREQTETLSRIIEGDLAISAQNQQFEKDLKNDG